MRGAISSDEGFEYAYERINKLMAKCQGRIESAQRRAEIYRIVNIFFNLIVVISGASITLILSLADSVVTKNISIGLGASISIISTLMKVFDIPTKSLSYKSDSIMLSRMINQLQVKAFQSNNWNDILQECAIVEQKMDELDLSLYRIVSEAPPLTSSGRNLPSVSI